MTRIAEESRRAPGGGAAAIRGRAGRGAFLLAVAACLLGIAVLAVLGTWQVERLAWKNALVETIDARIHAAPASLAEIETVFAETGDVDYRPVRLAGRFLHGAERHFLSTFEGAPGWNVFTPLRLDDGRTVFVNRGFVPYALKAATTRPAGLVEGPVAISGIARNALSEKPGSMVPDNDPAANVFFWKNLADVTRGLAPADVAGLLPFVVDAGPGAAPGGWPVGGTTVVDLPNSHLQYAVTWYGLALVLAVMLAGLLVRRMRPAPRPG